MAAPKRTPPVVVAAVVLVAATAVPPTDHPTKVAPAASIATAWLVTIAAVVPAPTTPPAVELKTPSPKPYVDLSFWSYAFNTVLN